MEPITHMIIYLLIGLFAGFMSGMFGIGGGAVRIPLLNLVGLPLLSAFGINLFIVPFSSLVGAVSQRENIDKEIAIYLSIGGVFASSFFLSLMAAIRGGSAGSLFPAFLKAMGCDIHKAIATSLCVTIFTCIGAASIFWSRGDIIWLPAIFALTGSMVGVRFGSSVSLKTKSIWLEIGLAILVITLAFVTIYKAL